MSTNGQARLGENVSGITDPKGLPVFGRATVFPFRTCCPPWALQALFLEKIAVKPRSWVTADPTSHQHETVCVSTPSTSNKGTTSFTCGILETTECKHAANVLAILQAPPRKASVRFSKQTAWLREPTRRAAKLFQNCNVCRHQNTYKGMRKKPNSVSRSLRGVDGERQQTILR